MTDARPIPISAARAPTHPNTTLTHITSRRRRWGFRLGMVLVVYATLELLSLMLYTAVTGRRLSLTDLEQRRHSLSTSTNHTVVNTGDLPNNYVIHPYIGFAPEAGIDNYREGVSNTDIRILIVGGSVAANFQATSAPYIADIVAAAPCFSGRRVTVTSLAMPAAKQPQQLTSIAYCLALGHRYDIVINIDGFNEIESAMMNFDRGVYPAYPRFWLGLTSAASSADQLRQIGRLTLKREHRRNLARFTTQLRYSVTANTMWFFLDRIYQRHITETALAVQQSGQATRDRNSQPIYRTGPQRPLARDDVYALATRIWERSSRAIHHIVTAHGALYFQFLQPNQYVPGSKPMLDEERGRSISDAAQERRHGVEVGYPMLQAAGQSLADEGIQFHDLTRIFADITEPIYIDDCCHMNARGHHYMAVAIGEAIVGHLATLTPSD